MGAHNREQKHRNRYTRPGIADFPLHAHAASGSFGGSGKKTATGSGTLVLLGMRRSRAGVAGWICCATGGAVNFRFSVRHHTSGNHGDDWPRAPVEAERGPSPRLIDAHAAVAQTLRRQDPDPYTYTHSLTTPHRSHSRASHTAASPCRTLVYPACSPGHSGPRARRRAEDLSYSRMSTLLARWRQSLGPA